jgi:hypothetical protein
MVEQLGQVYAPLGLTLVDTRHELGPSDRGALEAPTDEPDTPATASPPDQFFQDQQPDQQERSSES